MHGEGFIRDFEHLVSPLTSDCLILYLGLFLQVIANFPFCPVRKYQSQISQIGCHDIEAWPVAMVVFQGL